MSRHELHSRTAKINKAQQTQSKDARQRALLWLAENFPEAFDNSLRIRPLKIGIIHDVLAESALAEKVGISKSKLREAVVIFARRIDYLACLKAQEMRIDLKGQPTTQVTILEAEQAALKLKKRVEKCAYHAKKEAMSSNKIKSIDNSEPRTALPSFPERSPAFSAQNAPARPVSVLVKHKSSKQFDPEAVARLKEKLGLAHKAKE